MKTIKYEVWVKYTRHPFLKDGSIDKSKKESSTWFTIVHNNGKSMTESAVRSAAKEQFLKNKINHTKIDNIRIEKREAY